MVIVFHCPSIALERLNGAVSIGPILSLQPQHKTVSASEKSLDGVDYSKGDQIARSPEACARVYDHLLQECVARDVKARGTNLGRVYYLCPCEMR